MHLKSDIQENVMDADDTLVRCSGCENDDDFDVYIDKMHMKVEKGNNQILEIKGDTRIWKMSDIVFICPKCRSVVLESCL